MSAILERHGEMLHERRERPADMPVTNALNAALVAIVLATAVGLLWLGSHVPAWPYTLLVGVVFSYVLLTNYALLHEASHNNLHSDPRLNYALGMVAGLLFPMPLSMIQVTHQGHHLRNRTDHEMFDMYYPTDSRLLRTLQWYSILGGLFWPVIPLGAVLFALCPPVLRTRLFRRERSSSYLLGDIRDLPKATGSCILLTSYLTIVLHLIDKTAWRRAVAVFPCAAGVPVNWKRGRFQIARIWKR